MSKACYQISWGLLLILIDIRIEFFDLFPDILGYILLLAGFNRLKQENRYFEIGNKAGWLVMIVSIIQFLTTFGQQTSSMYSIGDMTLMEAAMQIVSLIGNMILGYCICKGIECRAEGLKQTVLKQAAQTRLRFFLIIQLMWLIVMPFSLNLDQDIMLPILFTIGIAVIISWLSIVLLARAAGRLWKDRQGIAL